VGHRNGYDYGTRRRRCGDRTHTQRCHLCSQHELQPILTRGGIRQGIRDANHTWIWPQNLPWRHPSRPISTSCRRIIPVENTSGFSSRPRCTNQRTGTGTRREDLASKIGTSRRRQHQETGKDGRWDGNKIQDFSGSMRCMFGRETAQTSISPTWHQSNGGTRTRTQRPMRTNRPHDLRRIEILSPFQGRPRQDESYLSPQEEIIGRSVREVHGIQSRGRKANGKGDQKVENGRWRRVRKMDGGSSQGDRHYSRNNSTLQSRPERRRRMRESNDRGKSQVNHCRIQT
jgi:hypothetical protein